LGKIRRALSIQRQVLAIYQEIGDRESEGIILSSLANSYDALRLASRAIDLYKRALAIAREVGDARNEGNTLYNLSGTQYRLGKRTEAIETVGNAIQVLDRIRDPLLTKARDRLAGWTTAGYRRP
jgi:tetratricopeptide (TPR) repeat protein